MYPGSYGFCFTDKRLVGKSEYGDSFDIPTNEILSFEKKGFLSNKFIVHTSSNSSKEINVENLSSIGDFVNCLNQILNILPNNKRAIQIREAELNKKILEASITHINKHPWLVEYLGMEEKVEKMRRRANPVSKAPQSTNVSSNQIASHQPSATSSPNKSNSNNTNNSNKLQKSSTKDTYKASNPLNNISSMTADELQAKLMSIKTKNCCNKFYELNTPKFISKLPKAISAYATLTNDERPIVMDDATVFGSAKEGFVLTNKRIYIKQSFSSKECILIKDVSNIIAEKNSSSSSSLTYVYLIANNTKHQIYFASDATEAEQCKNYIFELITLLKYVSSEPQYSPQANNWVCSCGNTNTGKFCTKCGSPKNN